MLKIAICDDNEVICSEIENIILEYKKNYLCDIDIEVFWSGESLIDFLMNEHNFDIIFLDIELGRVNGVDVGKTIRNIFHDHLSKIVFISGAEGYDRQLFEIQPLNFLQKPIKKEGIIKCINLALEILGVSNTYFEYKIGALTERVTYENIIYFESKLKKVKIVMMDGTKEFYGSLEKIKEDLPKMFISPHRSFVINFANVQRIQTENLTMINGVNVPISQRSLKNIRTLQLEIEKEKRDARL